MKEFFKKAWWLFVVVCMLGVIAQTLYFIETENWIALLKRFLIMAVTFVLIHFDFFPTILWKLRQVFNPNDWISVRDRLPYRAGKYFVKSDTQGQSGTGFWNGSDWEYVKLAKGSLLLTLRDDITHWKAMGGKNGS